MATNELPLPDAVLRDLVEGAPDAIVVVDRAGTIVYANAQSETMFGFGRADLIGSPVEMLVPERYAAGHVDHRGSFFGDPRSRPMGVGLELFGRRKDGTEFPVEISLVALHLEDGVIVSAAIRDVTERARAADAMRASFEREQEAAEGLRALDEMKNTLLHAVSHELRSPLAVIVGFADTLVTSRARLPEEQVQRMIEGISTNAARLNNLLTDLLDLDRLSRGVIEPMRAPTDIGEIARRAIAELNLGDRAITVAAPDEPALIDASKVERIVENLLVNAARYSGEGAPIDVTVERRGDVVILEVADRGPGVKDQYKEAIFNAFERGDAPSGKQGTGIGLSLVARFAELHGGRAWVEDRPGGGASFKVLLPERAKSS